jgi:glycosyltransferase involved in cell wall biosynthesis
LSRVDDAGIDVAVLVPSWPGEDQRAALELCRGLSAIGDRPMTLGGWRPPDGQLRRRGFEAALGAAPLDYLGLRRAGPQAAHAAHVAAGAAAARWSEGTGRPSVLSHTGLPDRQWLTARRMRLRLTLRAVESCDAVVCPSGAAAGALQNSLGVDARVIPPPVDLDVFAPQRDRRAERPTVACPAGAEGTLAPAFEQVRRRLPDAVLLAVDGADPGAMAAAYRTAWAFVQPSARDGSGLALLESLACGTPVVGGRAGAAGEIVDAGVGATFEDGERDLAEAVFAAIELSGDEGSAAACRARAEESSGTACAAMYAALYRELMS